MLWLIVGIVLGLGVAYLVASSRSGGLRVRWYQWVLGAIAVVFLLLALQNYLALQSELEPNLASFALIAFGLPGVIAAALVWLLPMIIRAGGRKGARATVKTT
jgi:hypothetical protein